MTLGQMGKGKEISLMKLPLGISTILHSKLNVWEKKKYIFGFPFFFFCWEQTTFKWIQMDVRRNWEDSNEEK